METSKNPSNRAQATSNCTKSMVILHELALQGLACGVLNLECLKKIRRQTGSNNTVQF